MATQISYKKLDGGNSVAMVNGNINDLLQAKRELAYKLGLILVDQPEGMGDNVDDRLRNGGVDPNSVEIFQVSA